MREIGSEKYFARAKRRQEGKRTMEGTLIFVDINQQICFHIFVGFFFFTQLLNYYKMGNSEG